MHPISTNEAYTKPIILIQKIIDELEKKAGPKFIDCGQTWLFFEVRKEDLLPNVQISVTAPAVLSHYQLKGYVLCKE